MFGLPAEEGGNLKNINVTCCHSSVTAFVDVGERWQIKIAADFFQNVQRCFIANSVKTQVIIEPRIA